MGAQLWGGVSVLGALVQRRRVLDVRLSLPIIRGACPEEKRNSLTKQIEFRWLLHVLVWKPRPLSFSLRLASPEACKRVANLVSWAVFVRRQNGRGLVVAQSEMPSSCWDPAWIVWLLLQSFLLTTASCLVKP